MLAQHAQHAPLLVRQPMLAQARTGVGHDGFTRLQQQARQIAVGKGGWGTHLFNILNEYPLLTTRVFPCVGKNTIQAILKFYEYLSNQILTRPLKSQARRIHL
jgi:hypothetical protein